MRVVGNLPCMEMIVNPRWPPWIQFGQFVHLDESCKHHKTQCLYHLSNRMTKHKPHQKYIKKKSSTQFHIKDSESQAKNMAKNDYKKKKYKKDAKCKKPCQKRHQKIAPKFVQKYTDISKQKREI